VRSFVDKRVGNKKICGFRNEWKQFAGPAVCVIGSILLCVLLTIFRPEQGPVTEDGVIARSSYGGNVRSYPLLVEGLRENAVSVDVSVSAQVYTQSSIDEKFETIMEGMEERIRGDNPSLMEVNHDLNLPSRISSEGIRLRWYPSDSSFMSSSGKLLKEVDQPQELILSVELIADIQTAAGASADKDDLEDRKMSYHQSYEIPIRLIPVERTDEEQLMTDYQKHLEAADAAQADQETFRLPENFEGHTLKYRSGEKQGYGMIPMMGLLAAGLLWVREKNEQKEKEKKRERELLLDYSDLLSKMVVLTGAGLTIRNTWEKMVMDYEAARAAGRQPVRAAYEEMRQTCYQMKNGMPESEAYREFGKRCRLRQYLKLSGLLEQNRRSGTKNLREIFQTEMTDALEQRKNLALRMGEEAGTKLLVPLFMMLGIVMVMIMVPAMMSMG
jgi:hypothetical protein